MHVAECNTETYEADLHVAECNTEHYGAVLHGASENEVGASGYAVKWKFGFGKVAAVLLVKFVKFNQLFLLNFYQ